MRCDACGHEQDEGRWCGRCGAMQPAGRDQDGIGSGVDEHLLGQGHTEADPDAGKPDDATAPDRRSSWGAMALLAVVVGVVGAVALVDEPPDRAVPDGQPAHEETGSGEPEESRPSDGHVFGEPVDRALVFDAGDEGATALDLDTGATRTFRLPRGDTAGQPYPLLRLGDQMVVADGRAWAVSLGGQSDVRGLGAADYVVPDADPFRLWLITEADQQQTWTLVDTTSGTVIDRARVTERLTPVRGVPDGLAVRDEEGRLLLYDFRAQRVRPYLGSEAVIADAAADRMVWCDQRPCERLGVADVQADAVRTLRSDNVRAYDADAVWLSGGGSLLAARVRMDVDGAGAVEAEMHVYDVRANDLLARLPAPRTDVHGDWYGQQFFYRSVVGGSPSPLWRYVPGEGFDFADLASRDAPVTAFLAYRRAAVFDEQP